ncbi:hypothetical protein [Blastococcus sp. SYSU DS1024]
MRAVERGEQLDLALGSPQAVGRRRAERDDLHHQGIAVPLDELNGLLRTSAQRLDVDDVQRLDRLLDQGVVDVSHRRTLAMTLALPVSRA